MGAPQKWTLEMVKEKIREHGSVRNLRKAMREVYAAAWRNGWLKQLREYEDRQLLIRLIVEAENYESIEELREKALETYQIAHNHGWLGRLGIPETKRQKGRPREWSFRLLVAEAKKYQSRSEFILRSKSAYDTACRRGWIDLFDLPVKPNGGSQSYRKNWALGVVTNGLNSS